MNWSQALSQAYVDSDSEHAAAFLERLDPSALADYLKSLPQLKAVRLFSSLSPLAASQAFLQLETAAKTAILEEASADVCGALLRRLPEAEAAALLAKASKPRRDALRRILAYPADSAGGLMDPGYPAVMADLKAADAIAALRRHDRNGLNDIYVIDRQHKLLGAVAPSDLLLGDPQASARKLAVPVNGALSPFADAKSLLGNPHLAERRVLPVVSKDKLYLGALPYALLVSKIIDAGKPHPHAGREDAAADLGQLFKLGVDALASFVDAKRQQQTPERDRKPN